MANKRQRKKAEKRALRELQMRREQKALLDTLGMSQAEQMAIAKFAQKVEAENKIVDAQVDKDMDAAAVNAAANIKIPTVPAESESTVQLPRGSNVTAPQSRSTLRKAAEAPSALSGVIDSIKNFKIGKPTEDQKKTRSEIIKINNQLILTTKIIDANKDELTKLAETDSNVAKILSVSGSDQLKEIKAIQARILEGHEISADESKELITSLEQVTSTISSSQVSLEAKFSDISTNFSDLILNNDLEREDRRAMIEELIKITKSSDLQAQFSEEQKLAAKELELLSKTNLNFTEDQNVKLAGIFKQLKSEDLDRVKLRGTLTDLNESMESAVLTQDELKKRLEEKDDKGSSLKEKASEGISGLGKTLKAGAIDFLLSKVGLGGLGLGESLGAMIPGVGGVIGGLKTAGTFGGGLLSKGSGLLSKAGGAAGMLSKGGGLLKGAGRIAGKAALPLALAMSAYDAYKGFTNADEIAGVKKGEKATMGQKFGSAGASVLSGLTFGLAGDPTEIYASISKGVDSMLGEDGILTKAGAFLKKLFKFTPLGFIVNNFDSITKGFMSIFGAGGIISKMGKFLIDLPAMIFSTIKEFIENPASLIDKVKEGFGLVFDFLFGEEGLFTMNTIKKAIEFAAGGVLPDFIAKRLGIGGAAEPMPVQTTAARATGQRANVNSRASDLAVGDEKRIRAAREEQLTASKENKTVIVPTPAPASKPQSSRSTKVDDLGLAVMNAGMAGI